MKIIRKNNIMLKKYILNLIVIISSLTSNISESSINDMLAPGSFLKQGAEKTKGDGSFSRYSASSDLAKQREIF